uniref:Uncharacterized protein n=1 Tax=Anguilla anguilla TaxID=7936 RepID=A0A0E9TVK9_ANGAN
MILGVYTLRKHMKYIF